MNKADIRADDSVEERVIRSNVVGHTDKILATATEDGHVIVFISPSGEEWPLRDCAHRPTPGSHTKSNLDDGRGGLKSWRRGCDLHLEVKPFFVLCEQTMAHERDHPGDAVEWLTNWSCDNFGSWFARVQNEISEEWECVVEGYRRYLREVMPTGDDRALKQALKQVRAEEEILAGVQMADQKSACVLLGLSTRNPSATMGRKEVGMIWFRREGRPSYPLLQFNVEERSIYPVIPEIVKLARSAHWSNFRVLNWLLRPHKDFGGPPADALQHGGPELLAAFERAVEPVEHG